MDIYVYISKGPELRISGRNEKEVKELALNRFHGREIHGFCFGSGLLFRWMQIEKGWWMDGVVDVSLELEMLGYSGVARMNFDEKASSP